MSLTSAARLWPPRQRFDANSATAVSRVLAIKLKHPIAPPIQQVRRELGYDAWIAVSTATEAQAPATERTLYGDVAYIRQQCPVTGADAAGSHCTTRGSSHSGIPT